MDKSTISIVIFHSYVSHYQRLNPIKIPFNHHFPMVFLEFSHVPMGLPEATVFSARMVHQLEEERRAATADASPHHMLLGRGWRGDDRNWRARG